MTGSAATGAHQGADAVVVAAGSSRRMGGVDKLAALVGGRPLLAWSVAAIAASSRVERVVLVVAPDRVAGVAAAGWLPPGCEVVAGGCDAPGLRRRRRPPPRSRGPGGRDRPVLVHDGARPLVSTALVEAVIDAVVAPRRGHPRAAGRRDAQARGRRPHRRDRRTRRARRRADAPGRASAPAAGRLEPVPAGPPARFHRRGRPAGGLYHLGPCDSRRTCEPQGDAPRRPVAGRARADGARHPARRVRPRQPPVRPGRRRCGSAACRSPARRALAGHSDGDVVLHAVADALLGAAGLGDLGRLFPSDHRTPRGVDSSLLLREVVERLAASGLRPTSIDVTVIGARPRFGSRLDAMRSAIAATVGLDERPGQRQGLDREPVRRRGRGTLHLGPCGGDGPGRGMTIALQDTLTRRGPAARPDRARPTSASTAAARRSMARPTSGTSARSCSRTCSCATCAGAASR